MPILVFVIAWLFTAPVYAMETAARQAFIKDLSTDTVLLNKNGDQRMPTSSMSKVMTMYAVFEALRDGRLTLEDTLPVSVNAWEIGKVGSRMFAEPRQRISVEDLIRGVIVHSGNDATVIFAEGLAGSEEAFAEQITAIAQRLGMEDSNFANSSGLPDPDHYSTARDLALLAERLITDFPQYYHYYSEKDFVFNDIRQPNRNPLVQRDLADGLKTGRTEAAGYGLMASAERDGRRIIMVLNGLNSQRQRAVESERLLNWAFRNFETYSFFAPGEIVYEAPVWLGESASVPLQIDQAVTLTLERRLRDSVAFTVSLEEPVAAPITAGDRIGEVVLEAEGMETRRFPLTAAADVAALGPLARFRAAAGYLLFAADPQNAQ